MTRSNGCNFLTADPSCETLFYIIASIQSVIIVAGIILNLTVAITFRKLPAVKKNIPNILLFNQCLADLFNVTIYGVMNVLSLLLVRLLPLVTYSDVVYAIWVSTDFFHTMTLYSSILLLCVIAFERFLAVSMPLWHRAHKRKRHPWIAAVVVWCVTIGISL